MTRRLQNRPTACLITLCMVAVAVLLGGRSSLATLRLQAENYFYSADGDYYASIDYDLSEITADSNNLLTVAGRYLEQNDIMMEAVRKDLRMLAEARSFSSRHAYAENLRASLNDLDRLMLTLNLSDTDKTYHAKLTANLESRYRVIGNNSYNQRAASFNGILEQQPAALLASVTGVKPLELYE